MFRSYWSSLLPYLLGADNRRRQRTALDVDATEEPILSPCAVVALAGQTKYTKMPVSAVGRCASREGSRSLCERVAASRVPEADLVRREVLQSC
jgi:hypothetical protein